MICEIRHLRMQHKNCTVNDDDVITFVYRKLFLIFLNYCQLRLNFTCRYKHLLTA